MVPVQNVLGESPLWNVRDARLWWTDIQGRRLFRYDPAARTLDEIATPERLCSFAFVAGSGRLIAAFESGLAFYDPANGAVEWLYRLERGTAPIRFNDGRTDRQGRFWAGTMVEGEGREPLGRLYCLDRNGQVRRQPDPVFISNALCTSPDGSLLYFADSPRRTIFVYNLDRISGVLSNRRRFVETPEGAFPDGANVDREGFVWNAHWGAGRIVRYAPDGCIDRTIEVPASQPSCIAFGGPEMNLLFVTSARDGLRDDVLLSQPGAGNLFVYTTDITGLPDADFIFEQVH
jgi:sugar lactone lactonase YvrE